jgi:hypothetical protein
MTRYVFRALSSQEHNTGIVQQSLTCPTIQRLVFPASLPVAPGKAIRLETLGEFELSLVPREFYTEDLVNIPLEGINGIEFSVTIHFLRGSQTKDVINLLFTSEHLKNHTISNAHLKALAEEVIPIFQCNHLSVYDETIIQYQERPKYFAGPHGKNYPVEIGWMTYFGPELVEFLGRAKFDAMQTCAEKYDLYGGVLVILQETPFQADEASHREREAKAIAELGLDEFTKQRR